MAKKRKAKKVGRKKVVKRKAKKKVRRKVVKKKAKRKVVKRKAKKKVTRKVKRKSKKKRKLNPALMKTLTASPALADIVGSKRITRQKAIKYFWVHVKKHRLQDSQDRRQINLDAKLKGLFGKNKRQVSMFEATKVISKNLT